VSSALVRVLLVAIGVSVVAFLLTRPTAPPVAERS
jgi:hypothetical protein